MTPPRPANPSYAHLWDACCYRNQFKVKLHMWPSPEGMSARRETFYPTVPMEDWEHARSSEKIGPMTERHVARTISFFVEVWDGGALAASGDLGPNLTGYLAVRQLRRMCGVLVEQGRLKASDLPHLRP